MDYGVGLSTLSRVRPSRPAPPLRDAWYVVARARDLRRPLGVKLLGRRIVVFRGESGLAALEDRCPHRGAPLSMGRLHGDLLECPYHGWRFDDAGQCRYIPALAAPRLGRAHSVPSYAVRESEGLVWVCPGEPPAALPQAYPSGEGYVSYLVQERLPADLVAVAENILDVPHTAFLHGGWFRRPPSAARRVDVTRGDTFASARFLDEEIPGGLLGKLLAGGRAQTLHHEDRFELPSLAVVDYRLGGAHLQIRNLLTPVEMDQTQIWAVASLKMPWLARLVAWISAPVARRVLKQDLTMLTAIAAQGSDGPMVSTQADLLRPHISKLLRAAAAGRTVPPHESKVELRL